jgi:hypothetical protein
MIRCGNGGIAVIARLLAASSILLAVPASALDLEN